jgi:hypothetical protein
MRIQPVVLKTFSANAVCPIGSTGNPFVKGKATKMKHEQMDHLGHEIQLRVITSAFD